MTYETILTERDGVAQVLTLNRPARRNAMSIQMTRDLIDAMKQAEADPAVRGVIVTGGSEFFSSGADLNEALAVEGVVRIATWQISTRRWRSRPSWTRSIT